MKNFVMVVLPGASGFESSSSKPVFFIQKVSDINLTDYAGHYKGDAGSFHFIRNTPRKDTLETGTYFVSKVQRFDIERLEYYTGIHNTMMLNACRWSSLILGDVEIYRDQWCDKLCMIGMLMINAGKRLSTFMAEFRFLMSACSSYANRVDTLIEDKFTMNRQTILDVWVMNQAAKGLPEFCSQAGDSIQTDENDLQGGKMKMPRILTSGKGVSLQDVFDEMYLPNLMPKEGTNPQHDKVKCAKSSVKYFFVIPYE
jgi:hypothetical protein